MAGDFEMGSGVWLEKHGKCANISTCRLERVVLAVLTYLCNRSTYLILNLSSSGLVVSSRFTKPMKSGERLVLGVTLTYTSATGARLVCNFTDCSSARNTVAVLITIFPPLICKISVFKTK